MKETYSRTKPVWARMNEDERKATMEYGERYKKFLDTARTERLAVTEILRQAEEAGFKPLYDMKELKPGDKVFWNQKGKSVVLAVIGKKPVHDGLKIVGSHLDTPRLDLKGNPVHESGLFPDPLLWWNQEVSVDLHSYGTHRGSIYPQWEKGGNQCRDEG